MPERSEFLLSVQGPQGTQTVPLPAGTLTIGRQPGNDLVLDDAQVSRRHARIECSAGECRITDLGSSNGTRVAGERLPPNVPAVLSPGARIRIGSYELVFEKKLLPAEDDPEEEILSGEPVPAGKLEHTGETGDPVSGSVPTPELVGNGPVLETSRAAERSTGRSTLPGQAGPPQTGAAPAIDGQASPVPPGLSIHSRRLLGYLPGIYHTDLMSRFLGIFESIQAPIEWTIDNFDLFLAPETAPGDFLAWLANWYAIAFGPDWSEAKRRLLLEEAHRIYARRGTRWALSRVLEIYTSRPPEIADNLENLPPFTFRVRLPMRRAEVDLEPLQALIDANKPAHTMYVLEFDG